MIYKTLISAQSLQENLNNPDWIIIDCRFSLANTEVGFYNYKRGHIPNARYAHLDKDLSSQITSHTGRHPLPDFRVLVKKLSQWGVVTNRSQVIVYDDAAGAFAGRLWWLLRCLGHEAVAVLDGGISHWQKLGFPLTTILPNNKASTFRAYLNCNEWLVARQVEDGIARKLLCVLDARTPERYRGENEPIDKIAGHIPTAFNRPFHLNLKNGLFLEPAVLKAQFNALMGKYTPKQVVHYCGSGVTACHNLLAMEYAGLHGSTLYAGSWSEWIRNQNRCVAIGNE